ncbi:type VII secretion integral membrane protein EccD [Streptomyces sp. NPDC013181]|uniref:type VII secretion integral membrane protein EccD n=1 Tax=Streptomyces sp. NPDC013181 TaxID=3364864 RepID=UPI003676BF48
MSSTVTTAGFCRVTVVAPDGRVDVALPDDVPVADLLPEILRLTGQEAPPGAPPGYHLTRRDHTVVDPARTLGAQRVPDGDVLRLRPFTESLPPAVFDDVADAVASAVRRDRTLWHDGLLGTAGLLGGALFFLLTALVLWCADPVRHDTHGLPGIVAAVVGGLLAVCAGVRARRYGDRAAAAALGLAALPHAMIAGSGLLPPDPGAGSGRLRFMLGCAAVLVVSAALVVAVPDGDAPFVAVVAASATGTLAAFTAIVAEARPRETAAVCLVVAIGALAFLPGLSARVARLPVGYAAPPPATDADPEAEPGAEPGLGAPDPVDVARVAARARRGHELLLGLVGGCCLVIVAAAAVLGFSADGWARALALVAGLAVLLRARLFRHTAQVATVLGAGAAALSLLVTGLALHTPAGAASDPRMLWLAVAVTCGAALLTGVALIVPRKGLSPFWGRLSDLAEMLLLLALIPLCLAVLDLYAAARTMTG